MKSLVNSRGTLVSGGSGLIGTSLVRALAAKPIHLIKLVRRPIAPGEQAIVWDPAKEAETLPGLNELDAAIHLSGANVAGQRWTTAYKEEMLRSRVESTRNLCRLLVRLRQPPAVLVCASAIGIYGDRGDKILDEASAAGSGLLADTCRQWEAATREAESAGIRVVHLRFGVVLASAGGALGKMLPLFRLGLGGRMGPGNQWMSWVTLEDSVQIILRAIEDMSLSGPVNVTSPGPVTNAEFTRVLGRVLGRPAVLAVPAFALRLAVGGMADEALLASCRALPKKLLEAGYVFKDAELEPALQKLLA